LREQRRGRNRGRSAIVSRLRRRCEKLDRRSSLVAMTGYSMSPNSEMDRRLEYYGLAKLGDSLHRGFDVLEGS
jgi:hypothetical protein